MGYRREDYIKVNELFAERRARAEAEAEARTRELYAKLPRLLEIDRELARTSAKVADAIRGGEEGLSARMAKIEAENISLQRKRAALLAENGYPADYTNPAYACPDCSDTGFIGRKECICRRRALVMAGYESSGIGALLRTQTFDTFSPAYNSGSATIMRNYQTMKSYAENFRGEGDENLLLVGGTGLGKTHLSTAAAGVIIERGFDVKYETAQNMLSEFENRQFYRSYGSGGSDGDASDPTARYFDCDLLIIDDLGTEMTNQFTVSCLYNLINTRVNRRAAMVINTNLSAQELRKRYADRITSRLFGEFSVLLFEGSDVRAEKLRKTQI